MNVQVTHLTFYENKNFNELTRRRSKEVSLLRTIREVIRRFSALSENYSRSIWKRDDSCPVYTRRLYSHRAIMKSKLQIMTGHNSRSLFRALCSIVALHSAPSVRPVAYRWFARSRPWALMPIWIPASICVQRRTDRCNMPWTVKSRDPSRFARKKRRIEHTGSFVRGMFYGFFFAERKKLEKETWSSSFRSSPGYFIANLSGLNASVSQGSFDHYFFY